LPWPVAAGGSGTMPETEKCDEGYTGTPPDCKKIEVVDPEPGPDAAAIAAAIEDHKTTSGTPSILFGGSDIKVAHKDGATSITVTRRDNGEEDTGTAAAHQMSGWSGRQYSFSEGETDHRGSIFSNIHAPRAVKYLTFFAAASGGVGAVTTDEGATNGNIVFTASGNTFKAENFSGAVLPGAVPEGTTSTTKTIAANGNVAGSFYGVPGKFECGGTACVVTRDGEGDISLDNDITFNPDGDAGDIIVKGVGKDEDYLHFGYWFDGDRLYTFSGESGYMRTAGDITPALETADITAATYRGAAAGAYVQGSSAGEFDADADLTANFAGDNISDDDAYTISGKISDFNAATGNGNLDAWELTLGKIDFGNAANSEVVQSASATGVTTSPDAANGEWRMTLYGSTATAVPSAVTGQFNGNFGAGNHAAGAFGATSD